MLGEVKGQKSVKPQLFTSHMNVIDNSLHAEWEELN
jgi:hypothetical protein